MRIGGLLKILPMFFIANVELTDKGAVVVREHHIAVTAGQHLPEPDMESAETPQLPAIQ